VIRTAVTNRLYTTKREEPISRRKKGAIPRDRGGEKAEKGNQHLSPRKTIGHVYRESDRAHNPRNKARKKPGKKKEEPGPDFS